MILLLELLLDILVITYYPFVDIAILTRIVYLSWILSLIVQMAGEQICSPKQSLAELSGE